MTDVTYRHDPQKDHRLSYSTQEPAQRFELGEWSSKHDSIGPHAIDLIKNCVVGNLVTCSKFQNEIHRLSILQVLEYLILLLIVAWALKQCSANVLPVISSSRRYLTVNIPETVRDTDIVTMKY